MTKVLLFGTHPNQFNGYSKVVYELCKCMAKRSDFQVSVYGFQNFYTNPNHRKDFPSNVYVYDAFAHENPKGMGFGIGEIKEFVKTNKPDVCIIYNDMLVITQVIQQLKAVEGHSFKIIAYIDQVYLNQKKEFIDFINQNADVAMLFTKYWEDNIKEQGITIPTCFLQHGFNKNAYFPIDRHVARQYFGIKPDDVVLLNLNRCQPRKRWDICLKAFAEVVSRRPESNVKLMIATALHGSWNLLEIYERELKKRNITMEVGMKHLIVLDNPQRLTDEETNILYNVGDIGVNTCDGEGFGLCNFEQAGVGIPQIVPRLGGFVDYFDDDNARLIDPTMAYYVDNTRDMVCGEALLCDYMDFVDAIEELLDNPEARKRIGERARQRIVNEYSWDKIADQLCDIVRNTVAHGSPVPKVPVTMAAEPQQQQPTTTAITSPTKEEPLPQALEDEVEKIDINLLHAAMASDAPAQTTSAIASSHVVEHQVTPDLIVQEDSQATSQTDKEVAEVLPAARKKKRVPVIDDSSSSEKDSSSASEEESSKKTKRSKKSSKKSKPDLKQLLKLQKQLAQLLDDYASDA